MLLFLSFGVSVSVLAVSRLRSAFGVSLVVFRAVLLHSLASAIGKLTLFGTGLYVFGLWFFARLASRVLLAVVFVFARSLLRLACLGCCLRRFLCCREGSAR